MEEYFGGSQPLRSIWNQGSPGGPGCHEGPGHLPGMLIVLLWITGSLCTVHWVTVPLYTVHCALYTVHCVIVHCALCTVHCFSVNWAVHCAWKQEASILTNLLFQWNFHVILDFQKNIFSPTSMFSLTSILDSCGELPTLRSFLPRKHSLTS